MHGRIWYHMSEPNHDPNVPTLIWNMAGFRTLSVPNLTMFQIRFGISQIKFGVKITFQTRTFPNRKLRFGMFEIEITIWECSKSNSEQKCIGLQHDQRVC